MAVLLLRKTLFVKKSNNQKGTINCYIPIVCTICK
jgi:hypothetical protein